MFGNNTIAKRVMTVIKQKIKDAQAAYENEVEQLETAFDEKIETLHATHEQEKIDVADKHVNAILGKIL